MAISEAARIKEQLKHPIVDADGHWIEPRPILLEFLRDVAGPTVTDKYLKLQQLEKWTGATPEVRMAKRLRRNQPWIGNAAGAPSDTLTRATCMLPALMRERMEELGIDFMVVYTTMGLSLHHIGDEDVRRGIIRAYNAMTAEFYAPHRAVFAPAAIVPTITPAEAIDEAEHAARELGFKVIMVRTAVPRPLRSAVDGPWDTIFEDCTRRMPYYVDTLGLDNDQDWDPFWQRCIELGLAVTVHGGAHEWPDRKAVNNFVYNHTGHFAQANHAATKGMFLGGVTHRFPKLNVAFLEGGAGYAMNLLQDLVGHWEKLNLEAIERNLCPQQLDAERLRQYLLEYGGERIRSRLDAVMASINTTGTMDEAVDDFAALDVHSKEELIALFTRSFFFGCEADDPLTAWAFDRRMGARLNAVFSSDISHFDVPDITAVVPEAYELVEHGLIDEADFRDFTFANAVRLHGGANPDFFKGTTVERQAAEVLAA
jgi:predicted TIM-barrel fold metal-dependent hydrolase